MAANKYSIKDGMVYRPNGPLSSITNDNLTDAIAEFYISKDPTLLGTVIIKNREIKKQLINKSKKK